jgi:serine protease inhibitor
MKKVIALLAALFFLPAAYYGWLVWEERTVYQRNLVRMMAASDKIQEEERLAVFPDLPPAPAVPPDFALKLYKAVAGAEKRGNVFLSPAGARWLLGMAYAGASSGTKAELAVLLGGAPPQRNLKDEAARLASLLAADPRVSLKVANGLWLKKGYPFKDSFSAEVRENLGAAVFVRDFTPADVAEANAWASRQTEGRIRTVLDKFGKKDRALLANAVYFKGKWSYPFEEKNTREQDFTLASGAKVRCELMSDSGRYEYHQGSDFQALRLPYGNGRLGMVLLLPSPQLGLEGLNGRLTPEFWRSTLAALTAQPGSVLLPRFKLEYSSGLTKPLKALGLNLPFDKEKADFSCMAKLEKDQENLYLSEVLQSAFVEVNEQGTEAAAVTRAGFYGHFTSVKRETPFVFRADRPFLYAIEYRVTGEILFLGALNDPGQN